MLVFGESILNDAVAIVLTNVIVESKQSLAHLATNKIKAISMIGLLATSNLTTISSSTSVNSGLINHGGKYLGLNQGVNVPEYYKNENINNEDSEQELVNDYDDHRYVPAKREGKYGFNLIPVKSKSSLKGTPSGFLQTARRKTMKFSE
jgi:hypothetical protein